jgi:hypothetical protein
MFFSPPSLSLAHIARPRRDTRLTRPKSTRHTHRPSSPLRRTATHPTLTRISPMITRPPLPLFVPCVLHSHLHNLWAWKTLLAHQAHPPTTHTPLARSLPALLLPHPVGRPVTHQSGATVLPSHLIRTLPLYRGNNFIGDHQTMASPTLNPNPGDAVVLPPTPPVIPIWTGTITCNPMLKLKRHKRQPMLKLRHPKRPHRLLPLGVGQR